MTPGSAKTRGNWVPDLLAGLTTGVANIPDAMASSILAGVNPVQGLYAIMVGTPLGALVGSSAFMNIATTSALAITAGLALAGGQLAHAPGATRRKAQVKHKLVFTLAILAITLAACGDGSLTGVTWTVAN